MRAIDADRLANGLKLHYQSTDQEYEIDRQWAIGYNAGLERALYSIAYAPTLTPQNEPLTIEQLREMDGEPVWLEIADGVWGLIDTDDGCVWLDRGGSVEICKLNGKAYRRPPEGEANGK